MGCGGSSPLARGPRLLVQLLVRYIGLIPARAGTTIAVVLALDEIGAHPRSRGDHVRAGVHYCLRGGSSPLARGPRARVFAGDFAPGLIPARAGTTCLFLYIWCVGWAHPRSRGDHRKLKPHGTYAAGSSPLARGPHLALFFCLAGRGLIPARAGTTKKENPLAALNRAHPRSRGDHPRTISPATSSRGSSPLARGPPAFS